jgi:excinuclease UvrABC nuclease subunit
MTDEACVYRHFDGDGRLLYVGCSLNPIMRLQQHRRSCWFDQIARVDIERHATRREALAAEATAIRLENPKYNSVAPQSALTGVKQSRRGKFEARHRGQRIGLFETCEAAADAYWDAVEQHQQECRASLEALCAEWRKIEQRHFPRRKEAA